MTGLLGTASDLDPRTMTPDQMNLDALIQSRDYFTATASDLASTNDLGKVMARSGELSASELSEAQAGGGTYSVEEGQDTGGCTKYPHTTPPRQVSVMMPSVGEEDSATDGSPDDLSHISLT